jgi:hypothetical protein
VARTQTFFFLTSAVIFSSIIKCPLIRSGLKTSPQAQFLCWAKGFNTRNIKYIPAFESLGLP